MTLRQQIYLDKQKQTKQKKTCC